MKIQLQFQHITSKLYYYPIGKTSKMVALKLVTPPHQMTCSALVKLQSIAPLRTKQLQQTFSKILLREINIIKTKMSIIITISEHLLFIM